jgi:hypothetical protein
MRHVLRATIALVGAVAATMTVNVPSSHAEPRAVVDRDYGTPTVADGKVCPFAGDVPTSLNTGSVPVGSAVPGHGGLSAPGQELASHIYSELCMSKASLAQARAGKPPAVLVLVHGITYGTWYWDLPYQSGTYSAVNYLIKRGYATLNIDRLGEGRSDHPASALVTASTNADAVHQLISALRGGKIGGIPFKYVGTVGHSYGTLTNWRETAQYNDADTTIGTGYSDAINPVTAMTFVSKASPASTDSRYAGAAWAQDPGYLQPWPSARGISQLYNVADADPAVIELDKKLANTVTGPELMTFPPAEYDGSHKNMAIPTFLIDGERDELACGNNDEMCATSASQSAGPAELEKAGDRLRDWQSPALGPNTCLRAAIVPDAAHDINMHRNAQQLYALIAYFADMAMGNHGQNAAAYKAACQGSGSSVPLPSPLTPGVTPPADLTNPPSDRSRG